MTSPRGIRNRNPGNIVVSGWTQRQAGYSGPEPQGRFATFDTMTNGVAALLRLLDVYREQHGLATVRGIIDRWAPPVENNTSAYVLAVCRALGVQPDDVLPADSETFVALARAIIAHENGRDAAVAVTDTDYADAARAVFGTASQAAGGSSSPAPSTAPEPVAVSPPAPAAPPAPSPSWRNRMSPLLLPAISAVVDAIPSLVKLFGSGSRVAERNAKAVEIVSAVVKEATGLESVAAGAEQVLADPAVRAKVEQAVQAKWFDLQEAGGGGIAGARAADAAMIDAGGPWWSFLRSPSFWALLLLLPLVYLIVLSLIGVLGPVQWSDDVRSALAGTIVGTVIGGAVGYYWGQNTSRNRVPPAPSVN